MQDLKLGISILGGLWWTMKLIWGIRSPIFLVKTKTLICGLSAYEVSLFDQPLRILEYFRSLVRNVLRKERECFGVQKLPLFNLLKPEELDWLVRHSWLEDRRWLNTQVPKNLHSPMQEVTLLVYYTGNGLKYDVWGVTKSRRRWAYICHLKVMESRWRWVNRCHPG